MDWNQLKAWNNATFSITSKNVEIFPVRKRIQHAEPAAALSHSTVCVFLERRQWNSLKYYRMLWEHDVQDVEKKKNCLSIYICLWKRLRCVATQRKQDQLCSRRWPINLKAKRNQFRKPALRILHSEAAPSSCSAHYATSWKCHGKEALFVLWNIVQDQSISDGNSLSHCSATLFCHLQSDRTLFRGAGVILQNTWLDLRTTPDVFDRWKWRGKCSWRMEKAIGAGMGRVLRDLKNAMLCISVTERRKKKHTHKAKLKQTSLLTSGWIALKTGASMSVIWPWRGSKTTDIRRTHSTDREFFNAYISKRYFASRKHCGPSLNCLF